MKEAQTKAAEPARQSPAAVRGAVTQHQMLGNLVDSSARVVTQRKAVHTAFGALGAVAQRAPDIDDEPLQKKPAPANNTGLPDNLKSGVEQLSGMSLDHVKVHYNSAQPAQMQALAYAQGSHIHVAPGQEQHLPHEAWHVVQQAQGRVKPTFQMRRGVEVNDDSGLEHEADVMGAKALGLPALGAAEGGVQRKALHASSSGAVQLVPKADVYRGGAELEYRQGRAEVRFQNLPVVEGTSEDAIKGLIRSGMKGISITSIAQGQALSGANWALTLETNSGTALNEEGRILVALELILGGPTGSTLTELLTAADAAAVALQALANDGVLNFGAVGNVIRDNAKSKKTKIAKGQAVIDDEAYVPALAVENDPLAADWSGLQVSGTWAPGEVAPHLGVWGLQVTIGAPLDELAVVGQALGGQGLTDTSVAEPRPGAERGVSWTAQDILLKWETTAGFPPLVHAPLDHNALWAQHFPQEPLAMDNEGQMERLFALMDIAEVQRKAMQAGDFRAQVTQRARLVNENYEAPSIATLNGLAKVLAAYARGAGGGRDQGPKHSMQFVTKNPLPSVINAAASTLPAGYVAGFRSACAGLVEDKIAGQTYNWRDHSLPVAEWATAIRDRNVDLVAAYDAAYRSAQIGGVAALNDVSDAEGEHREAPIIEFRDLGDKRPSQMRAVLQSIIDGLG